jgi:hypothetical protein
MEETNKEVQAEEVEAQEVTEETTKEVLMEETNKEVQAEEVEAQEVTEETTKEVLMEETNKELGEGHLAKKISEKLGKKNRSKWLHQKELKPVLSKNY